MSEATFGSNFWSYANSCASTLERHRYTWVAQRYSVNIKTQLQGLLLWHRCGWMVVLLREYSCPASEASVHWTVLISFWGARSHPVGTCPHRNRDGYSFKNRPATRVANCDCPWLLATCWMLASQAVSRLFGQFTGGPHENKKDCQRKYKYEFWTNPCR